jgi:hypothetical protein
MGRTNLPQDLLSSAVMPRFIRKSALRFLHNGNLTHQNMFRMYLTSACITAEIFHTCTATFDAGNLTVSLKGRRVASVSFLNQCT